MSDDRTAQEAWDDLREASRDLAYGVASAVGMLRLIRRLGMRPKPWVLEREGHEPDCVLASRGHEGPCVDEPPHLYDPRPDPRTHPEYWTE